MTTPEVTDQRDELRGLIRSWTSTLRAKSANTARSYEQAATRFLDGLEGEVDADEVVDYLDSLVDLAPASRAHHISAVRSFLRFAQSQGVIATGPIDLLVRPTVTVTSFNRYLDVEELQQLVAAARRLSPRHLATVLLLVGCGLRVAEASGATWRDLFRDPQGRLGVRVIGKGSKQRIVRVRDDVFEALVTLHGSDHLDARDTTPLLLDGQRTGYTTRGLHKLVAESGRSAELTKDVSPHWLRHTHATLAALGGASAFVIQSALGHSRLETSQRYVHWAKGLEDSSSDYLPAFG